MNHSSMKTENWNILLRIQLQLPLPKGLSISVQKKTSFLFFVDLERLALAHIVSQHPFQKRKNEEIFYYPIQATPKLSFNWNRILSALQMVNGADSPISKLIRFPWMPPLLKVSYIRGVSRSYRFNFKKNWWKDAMNFYALGVFSMASVAAFSYNILLT